MRDQWSFYLTHVPVNMTSATKQQRGRYPLFISGYLIKGNVPFC